MKKKSTLLNPAGIRKSRNLKTDFEMGEDLRGDDAIFIEAKHITKDGWHFDEAVSDFETFFRIIQNGKETRSHGWVKGKTIVQWG